MKVLLLNASEEILKVIGWQRAVRLFMSGKARKPHGYYDEYEISTVSGVFRLPSALVLIQYVHVPYKNAAINKKNVLIRDNYTCGYCEKHLTHASATIDHVLPQSRGGKHKWTNVVASCKECNNKKDNMTLQEFEKRYGIKLRIKPTVPSRDLIIMTGINIENCGTWSRWT